jgi:signal transduction histidine kinase
VCLVAAALVDLADPHMTATSTILDLGVGAAFFVLAALSNQQALQRLAWFSVGATWLAATVVPALGGVYEAALIAGVLLLGIDPRGRHRIVLWIVAVALVVVAVGRVPQPLVGMLLLASAAGIFVLGKRDGRAALAAGVAIGVGGTLVTAWLISRVAPADFDPDIARELYDVVLVVGVVALLVGEFTRVAAARRFPASAGTGLDGLQAVLARTLDDPDLRILRHVTPQGGDIVVEAADGPVVVRGAGLAMMDAETRAALTDAIGQTIERERLAAQLQEEQDEVDAARGRLAHAMEGRRSAMSQRLSENVLPHLRTALAALPSGDDGPRGLAEARIAVSATLTDVDTIVAGLADQRFRSERLADALRDLAVQMDAVARIRTDPYLEPSTAAALYFVAVEALTNARKHSDALHTELSLSGDSDGVVLVVRDDGRGGADPDGPGLRGIRERLQRIGATLAIDSSQGRGTTVVVTLPIDSLTRSSSTP